MIDFDKCAEMLDEIADSMPYELYRELNAGIAILPQKKLHPAALKNDLYILGEYIRNSLGNAIVFYYGSIMTVYGHLSEDELYKQLEKILRHELRHHNEYLAGVDDLGDWDKEQIAKYLEENEKNKTML